MAKTVEYDWDIFRIGWKKAQRLGCVTAPDAEKAVAIAIDEFDVLYADRLRIVARRNDGYEAACLNPTKSGPRVLRVRTD